MSSRGPAGRYHRGDRDSADRHGTAGAPFFRFNVIDMAREVEARVPVAAAVAGDGEVFAAELPAGW
jgi:hypothetical protein